MKHRFYILLLIILSVSTAIAQVGIGTTTPDDSAILDVESSNKGFLPPRMSTSERDNLLNPPEGLVIYNTDNIELEFASDGEWVNLSTNDRTPFSTSGSEPTSGDNVGIGTTTPSPYALLEVMSTEKGFLPPRMDTSQRDGISNPAEGLTIYNTDKNCIQSFKGFGWRNHCTPIGPTDVYNPETGQVWMDRNLGASQVATAFNDNNSFGGRYQWGRSTDGHQIRNSTRYNDEATGVGVANFDNDPSNPWFGLFITRDSGQNNWVDPSITNVGDLWQGVNGINNPCPNGYRIPTLEEWTNEINTWTTENRAGAYGSVLKLPVGGLRGRRDDSFADGNNGFYWTSTTSGNNTSRIRITPSAVNIASSDRANGYAVRCIKD